MSLNKAMLIGRLGQDPKLNKTDGGTSVVNLSVATSDGYTDEAGEWQETTDWHQVKVWGRRAENCAEYLSKGSEVYVEGKIKTRKWEDKEGTTRYSTHVKADRVDFMSSNSKSSTEEE